MTIPSQSHPASVDAGPVLTPSRRCINTKLISNTKSSRRKHTNSRNPVERRVPVNISISLKLLDALDEYAYKEFGTTSGKRSEAISKILKEHLHVT